MKYFSLILILIQFSVHADMDEHSTKALQQTQDMLKNPAERQKAIDKDAHAKDVDQKVDALVGKGQSKEDMYGMASELMEKITKESNGDPAKMQALLGEAQKNPQAFYDKYFSDAQKAKVRGIANKADKDGVSGPGAK